MIADAVCVRVCVRARKYDRKLVVMMADGYETDSQIDERTNIMDSRKDEQMTLDRHINILKAAATEESRLSNIYVNM